jgi:hypothetical protein
MTTVLRQSSATHLAHNPKAGDDIHGAGADADR